MYYSTPCQVFLRFSFL
uniref:Uncharacterized protein n=1 Tax=Anguilla anguilla TaxID=7936 RepID=A0A0E9TFW6_ANGAN